jgi:hypothetical protein
MSYLFEHEEKQLGPIAPLDSENHFAMDYSTPLSDHLVFRTSDKIDSEEIEIENAPRHSNHSHLASHRDGTSSRDKELKSFKLRRQAPNPRTRFTKEKVS